MSHSYFRLNASDISKLREMNKVFGEAFEDRITYRFENGEDRYFQDVLAKDHVITLVAESNGSLVGGLVAYRLDKLESQRSEIYIYDLAVSEKFRRQGIATGLINELKKIGKEMGAWAIFVQADKVDKPAVELYEKLGVREEPYHYDLTLD